MFTLICSTVLVTELTPGALSIAVTVSLMGFAVHTKHITQIAIRTLVMKLKWTRTGCLEINNKETYSNLRWPWGARKAS